MVVQKKKESVLFENASNLTHEFLNDNFNKKFLLNFLAKISHFPFKNEAPRSKGVKK